MMNATCAWHLACIPLLNVALGTEHYTHTSHELKKMKHLNQPVETFFVISLLVGKIY